MLKSADFFILDFLQEYLKSDISDRVFVFITTLGNGGAIWILMCLFLLFTKKYRKTGILLGAGLILGFLIGNLTLKPLIGRMRPSWINEEIALLIGNPTDFSFPSGHTLSSAVSAFIITYFHKKAGWLVIPLAVLIAFSRLYLYVHFPTDILGGAALGILIGFLVSKYGSKLLKYTKE